MPPGGGTIMEPMKGDLSRRDALKVVAATAAALARPRRVAAATELRLGTIKVPHWAATWIIPETIAKGVDVKLVEFKTSLELITALTAGSLDVGSIGYWHFIRMLDQGASVKA